MNKYKIVNFTLLFLALLALFSTLLYLEFICKTGNCSYDLRNIYLRPFVQVGITLSIVLGIFMFLPNHYFEKWLKWQFLWMFPVYLILIYALGDTSGGFFVTITHTMVAQFLGIIFGGISFVFVLTRFAFINFLKKTK